MPFRERVKRVLRSDRPDQSPAQQPAALPIGPASALVTSSGSLAPPAPRGPSLPAQDVKSVPEQLWEAGYNKLKNTEEALVKQYEARAKGSSIQELKYNLEDIEKLAKSRSKLENVDYILKLKSVVTAGLETSREATLAWTIVCATLEPILNVGREAVANREGLRYIVERLEFNNKLSTLRLNKGQDQASLTSLSHSNPWDNLQEELRSRITSLYAKILHYLMQSKIYYQQSAFKSYAMDSLKLYDWGKLLQDVKDAETAVDKDDAQGKAEANAANLQTITNIIRSQEDKECLRSLRVTDPSDDKERIELERGGLLGDAYVWVLDNDDYKAWSMCQTTSNSQNNNILWVRGDPGKGKTMLLCGIVNELSADDKILAYFFCQRTNPSLNSAESVVRGLLYMLADKDRTSKVLPLLREKFDNAGAAAFKDDNAWVVVKQLFEKTLLALSDHKIWLVVDALDECDQRDRLMDLIDNSPKHVNWLVSSRNWNDIEERFDLILQGQRALSLELNSDSVAKAVEIYIDIKVRSLEKLKRLDKITSRAVKEYLLVNADGTFLWVALVCRSLNGKKCMRYNILELVKKFPPDLNPMYRRIFEQIDDEPEPELIKRILSVAVTAFRPLGLAELGHLLEDPPNDNDYWSLMVNQTGFLTSQSGQVAFLHLSAKEFLLKSDLCMDSMPSPHQLMYERSMAILSATLRRNPYEMAKVGCTVDDLDAPDHDPLASVAYCCLYWTHHLLELWHCHLETDVRVHVEELFRNFSLKEYLFWLEALIWLRSLPHGVRAMLNLKRVFAASATVEMANQASEETKSLYRDALRFILSAINVDGYPLQLYASTLYFSPTSSPIRKAFAADIPTWLTSKHKANTKWSPHAINLGAWYHEHCITLSPDAHKLAFNGPDSTEIRDAVTGALELTLSILDGAGAAFSWDSRLVVVVTCQGRIAIFDCTSGNLMFDVIMEEYINDLATVNGFVNKTACVAVAPDGHVVHSLRKTLLYRDAKLNLLHKQELDEDIKLLALCPETAKLAIFTKSTLYLYDIESRSILWETTLFEPPWYPSAVFIQAGSVLVGSVAGTIRCWNTATGAKEESSVDESRGVRLLSLHDGELYYVLNWLTLTKRAGFTSEKVDILAQADGINFFAFTPYWLITFHAAQLTFYDTEEMEFARSMREIDDTISPNGHRVAYQLANKMTRVWDMALTWQDIDPFGDLESGTDFAWALSLSCDNQLAISRSNGDTVLWNIEGTPSTRALHTGPLAQLYEVTFSADGTYARYSEGNPHVMVVRPGCSALNIDTKAKHIGAIHISHGRYMVVACLEDLEGESPLTMDWLLRFQMWNLTSDGNLIWSFDINCHMSMVHTLKKALAFTSDGSQLGYIVQRPTEPVPEQLEVVETASGQLVETTKEPSRYEQLIYSEKTGHFRSTDKPIYHSDNGMELFVSYQDVKVDNEFILRLPLEYLFSTFQICGNSLIHALSADCVSVLEFDVEEAIRDESTRPRRRR